MKNWIENLFGDNWLQYANNWMESNLFVLESYVQLTIIIVSFAVAKFLARPLNTWLTRYQESDRGAQSVASLFSSLSRVSLQIIWAMILWLSIAIVAALHEPSRILVSVSSLLMAWIVINLVSGLVKHDAVRSVIATVAWTVAALNILGLLAPTAEVLDSLAFTFGQFRLSALGIIKALFSLVILLWLASLISRLADRQIMKTGAFTPSVEVLLSKTIKITVITLAFVAALTSVGIDLTALAVFGGAIGVGLGFGLQKIVANLVSGIILLLDKSIKPGDVIAVPDYYGKVDSLGARYVSVITRDGIEHLIPNEELITTRVENWSHSHNNIRLRLPVGVHYKSDVPKAMALCLEAAKETERVLSEPATNCLLRGFGDSSVDLEIRFWINDPMNGRANVKSAILLKVWQKFHDNDIEIPYPQRDIHIRTPGTGLSDE